MSRVKHLISLISGTEKREFDQVIKMYLKEEYNFNKIVITDGVNDTGIDIKVFDYKSKKIQYQLTTQKSSTKAEYLSFEKKVFEDFAKAKKNHEEYGYSNKLIFFYSYTLTQKKEREFNKAAFKDFGLDLEFIDANRLAEESENIIEIQNLLYDLDGINDFKIKINAFDKKEENLLFDLLSFGKPSEFKVQVIEVFILQIIFNSESLTRDQIIELCEAKFNVKENSVYYDKLLGGLLTNKRIKKSIDKQFYLLTQLEKKKINAKMQQFELDQKLFLSDVYKILNKFNQQDFIEEYIINLKELYINNFDSDLKSLLNDNDIDSNFSVIKDLLTFIDLKINDLSKSKEIAYKLLSYCIDSKFVQKISASKVYCNNINNNRLQNYLATQKKVYVDTQIGIYALCYFYKSSSNYDSYFFKSVKSLIEFSKNDEIKLFITERYIWEIQNHIKDAFKILPFTNLENFKELGKSKNVFYNFYINLLENDVIDCNTNFKAFLDDFGFHEKTSSNSFNSKIENHLDQMGIIKESYVKKYEIEYSNRLFNEILYNTNRYKSNWVRDNDSIMVEFLSDNDVNIHPLNPVFLTWDKTISEVQKIYFKEFPNAQQWMTLSPNKFIDVYAILKFSIDSETVSESLLALLSDDIFDNTHNLLDTIKNILNPQNEIGLVYTNKLIKIREQEINDINNNIVIPAENKEGEIVIDEVLFNLTNYFQDKEDEGKFESFKNLFTKKELVDNIISILNDSVTKYYNLGTFDKTIFEKFDNLIMGEKK